MKRILIIGSNGAGKTTFAEALSEQLQIPLTHIDKLYWRGNWEVTPADKFQQLLADEVEKPGWIIEGNNLRSLPKRPETADTVFWFCFSPIRCLWNVWKRNRKYKGAVPPYLPDQCVSRLSKHFIKDVWQFNKKNRNRIEKMLSAAPHIQLIRFSNYHQVKKYLNSITKGPVAKR